MVDYLPRLSDLPQAVHNILFHLRLRKDPPAFGRYDYTQKAEFWALLWGSALMIVTGLVLWFPALVTAQTPGWVVRVASVVHYFEAMLAVGAILVWHFFFVIFHPRMYPVSFTFITGQMSKEEWEHHHGLAAGTAHGHDTPPETDKEADDHVPGH